MDVGRRREGSHRGHRGSAWGGWKKLRWHDNLQILWGPPAFIKEPSPHLPHRVLPDFNALTRIFCLRILWSPHPTAHIPPFPLLPPIHSHPTDALRGSTRLILPFLYVRHRRSRSASVWGRVLYRRGCDSDGSNRPGCDVSDLTSKLF